jgi:hypothetical protein
MSIEIFGYIEILLIFYALFARAEKVVIVMGCLAMFIAAASVTIGGTTLNPAIVFLPVFAFRGLVGGKAPPTKQSRKAAIYFCAFIAYALLATLLCPRIFEDQITVGWTRHAAGLPDLHPLKPGEGNMTQMGYALGALVCFLASNAIFRRERGTETLIKLAFTLSAFLIFWSFVDLATYYTGTSFLLDFIRNGSYAILSNDTISGLRRISGTYTEASFYASNALALFAFMFSFYQTGVKKRLAGIYAIILFGLLMLSTSTTAYVGLALYISWVCFSYLLDLSKKGRIKRSIFVLSAAGLLAVFAFGLFCVFADGLHLIQQMVFEKLDSHSGTERSTWNRTAWNAFLDSYGFGVGIGSTIASSFVLVLLSNTGLIGTFLYGKFFTSATKIPESGSRPDLTRKAVFACRESLIAFMIGVSLSYFVFEIGMMPYIFLGAAAALSGNGAGTRTKPKGRLSHLKARPDAEQRKVGGQGPSPAIR